MQDPGRQDMTTEQIVAAINDLNQKHEDLLKQAMDALSEIEALRQRLKTQAVEQMRQLVADAGIEKDELVNLVFASAEKRRGRPTEQGTEKKAKPAPHRRRARNAGKLAMSRAPASNEPKYRDPETGKTWAGRGPTPKWLRENEAAGRSRDEFLIRQEQSPPAE